MEHQTLITITVILIATVLFVSIHSDNIVVNQFMMIGEMARDVVLEMLDEIAEKERSKQFDEDIKTEEEYEGLRTYRINTQAPAVRKVYRTCAFNSGI